MITKETIDKLGINEAQAAELNSFIETYKIDEAGQTVFVNSLLSIDADIKKKYDGVANTNAEAIIDGALKSVEVLTGIKREKGIKAKDYLETAGTLYISGKESALKEKERALDEKIKNGDVSSTVKKELEEVKAKLDELKKVEAEYEKVKDLSAKYPELESKHNSMILKNAFLSVKPTFPTEVNAYEASAKWKEFEAETLKKYTIAFNENDEAIGIDKNNQYKIVKLSDLVKNDKELSTLLAGRQQQGTNHKKVSGNKLNDIPFLLHDNATSEETQKAIQGYLTGPEKNLKVHDKEYAKQFADLNTKIYKAKQKIA
jgi:hypothetical protein